MGFPRQEYWRGLLFPFPGDLPDPEVTTIWLKWICLLYSWWSFYTRKPPSAPIDLFGESHTLCFVLHGLRGLVWLLDLSSRFWGSFLNLVALMSLTHLTLYLFFSKWKIPWMEEPGWLQSMGLRRVRNDQVTSLSFFTFMHWRRKWQPTPVFLPGESQGQGSLVGCRLWGHTESDTTEVTSQQQQQVGQCQWIQISPLVFKTLNFWIKQMVLSYWWLKQDRSGWATLSSLLRLPCLS